MSQEPKPAPPHSYLKSAPEMYIDLHHWLVGKGFSLGDTRDARVVPTASGVYKLGKMIVKIAQDRDWRYAIIFDEVRHIDLAREFSAESFVRFIDGIEPPDVDPSYVSEVGSPTYFKDFGAYHDKKRLRSINYLKDRFDEIRALMERDDAEEVAKAMYVQWLTWISEYEGGRDSWWITPELQADNSELLAWIENEGFDRAMQLDEERTYRRMRESMRKLPEQLRTMRKKMKEERLGKKPSDTHDWMADMKEEIGAEQFDELLQNLKKNDPYMQDKSDEEGKSK